MTGFLDPTLKFINLDQGNKEFHLTLLCPESAKKYTRATCHRETSLPKSCRLELCIFIKRDFDVFLRILRNSWKHCFHCTPPGDFFYSVLWVRILVDYRSWNENFRYIQIGLSWTSLKTHTKGFSLAKMETHWQTHA